MSYTENAYIFSLNAVLFSVHFASAFALIAYGIQEFPENERSTLGIYIRLWDKIEDDSCSRDLFVESTIPTHCGAIDINIYLFCALFGFVSGTYHLALACWALIPSTENSSWIVYTWTFLKTLGTMLVGNIDDGAFPPKRSVAEDLVAPISNWGANGYRWFDYSASTSLMIIVIYVSFGIFDAFTCLLAATAIVLLMVLGYATELVLSSGSPTSVTKPIVNNLIFTGFVALVAIFVPVIANMEVIIRSNCNEGGSKPPPAVQAVGTTLLLLFASFGLVPIYAVNRYDRTDVNSLKKYKYKADLAYSTLSMWVKTFLHWGLATIVIGQSTMVQGSYDEAQEICSAPDFGVLWGRFGIVIGITTGLSALTFLVGYKIISSF